MVTPEPAAEAKIPRIVTPPDWPVAMFFRVTIEIGFIGDNVPISVAQVSAVASQILARYGKNQNGLPDIKKIIEQIAPTPPFARICQKSRGPSF